MTLYHIFDRFVTDIREDQNIIPLGFDMEKAVQIGGYALVRTFYLDSNTRQGEGGSCLSNTWPFIDILLLAC
ncbi:hypothetical protein [Parabacteroides sp. AM58-2XD]|uniref:hypothetical protein n=1 Tax=Parabacteroides sp. AM58-2XD TaxID=2292362 RepID=UPI001F35B939|nr:hypothetical protein [Parabacteroides sp. AM58-2XD]